MASLILARGLHSLIATRETTLSQNSAWNALSKRNQSRDDTAANVVGLVLVVANIVFLVPVFLIIVYTIDRLYPTLVAVEADAPPEYELLASKEPTVQPHSELHGGSTSKDVVVPDDTDESSSSKLMPDETAGVPATPSEPITSSLFSTLRLLHTSGGGLYKAFRWRLLSNVVFGIAFWVVFNIPYMPIPLVIILPALAATKIETAWTHAVISNQRDGALYKTLPSYLSILKATAIPVVAEAVVNYLISAVALLTMGKRTGSVDPLGVLPVYEKTGSLTAVCTLLVTAVTLHACLSVPVNVMLIRTRAAMISGDASTMVPLDASIRAQSAEDMGFMAFLGVWRTFSRASWIRIVKANLKSIGFTVGIEIAVITFIFAQYLIFNLIVGPSKHN
ncbi:hypothetical protein VTL71DRAFT_13003 [Oculimacula yallundae]|uniref:Uncharacterized protein n=1 Tax=Oculimacula yallundae TaxID=86028 RepID=A0ABR4CQX2_9HELO